MEPKKRSLGAAERDEFLRAAWRLLVAGEVDADRLVFVDEMGTNVSLSLLYGWSPKGQRAFGSTPRNWAKNMTLLASITRRGLGPCLAVEGATTREVFEAYLEHLLAPTLSTPARNYGDVFGVLKLPQLQTKFAGGAWPAGHRGRRA
jgi:hypothetical protein